MASRAITVSIRGRSTCQILLVNDNDLESNLLHVRDLLVSQEVVGPTREFGFLTTGGSQITTAQEKLLSLKEIVDQPQQTTTGKKGSPTEPFEDLCESSIVHPDPDNKLKVDLQLHIRISPENGDEEEEEEEATSESCNIGQKEGVHTGKRKRKTDSSKSNPVCKFPCPFREFKDVFNIHDHVTFKTLIKTAVALCFLLVCFTFLAVFALHTLTTSFGLLDVVSRHGNPSPFSSGASELETRLQKVEMVLEYKMAELERRLAHVEENFLKELKSTLQDVGEMKASLWPGNKDKERKKDKEAKRGSPHM